MTSTGRCVYASTKSDVVGDAVRLFTAHVQCVASANRAQVWLESAGVPPIELLHSRVVEAGVDGYRVSVELPENAGVNVQLR
jgi:hypothetical protein